MLANGFAEEAQGRCGIPFNCQQKVDGLTFGIDRPVQIFPLPPDSDISPEQVRVLINYMVNAGEAPAPEFMRALAQRLPSGTKIWLVVGITDMRNGFNGLATKVQTALKDDPMSGHVFIFRGRSGSQVKLLWSTGDGLCLMTKRLERGRFAWPSARDGKVFLTPAQLAMLMECIDWRQPKRLLTSLTML